MVSDEPAKLPKGWYWKGKPATVTEHYKFELRLFAGDDNIDGITYDDYLMLKEMIRNNMKSCMCKAILLNALKI